MTSYVCLLISILCENNYINKYALEFDPDKLGGDVSDFPMEPENRAKLHALLPNDIRVQGPIVDVQEIAGVVPAAN